MTPTGALLQAVDSLGVLLKAGEAVADVDERRTREERFLGHSTVFLHTSKTQVICKRDD